MKILKNFKRGIKNILISALERRGIDLLRLAHQNLGILKYQNSDVSGENFLLQKILPSIVSSENNRKPVLFDVGANIGNYACLLAQKFPEAIIYAFEPNPITFRKLLLNTEQYKNIKAFNLGLGSKIGRLSFYTYKNDLESEHASLLKEVLTDIHKSKDINEMLVQIDTLEEFCLKHTIGTIDFIKIDTEGFEYEVLKGGLDMINFGKINSIQFEFNEMNVISRVFLKDFYDLLPQYDFFRLDSEKLIPLGNYHPKNEIFQFHNILLKKKIDS